MASFLVFVSLSIFMLLTVDLLSHLLRRTGWSRFISTFLLFYAQIISSEFLLGLLSILTGFSLVLLNLAVSGGLLFVLHRKFGDKKIRRYFSSLKVRPGNLKTSIRSDPLYAALLLLAAGLVAWIIFLGVLFPATDWDGNSYHLTFTGNVLQNHNFFDAPTSLRWLSGYPKGGEFIQMWSVIITHNDMLTDLAQLPFLGLAIYALYAIMVRIGADKRHARFSALLFLFLPIVLNQLKTTYVDVMLSSLFFAALAILVAKKLSKLDVVLVGILFSLLIAVKSTGFLFIIALVPLLAWNIYTNRPGRAKLPIKYYLRTLSLIALPMIFGLYWYAKDYISYGSPIYPFGFKLAGMTIFPGQTFQDFAASAVNQSTSFLPNGSLHRIWFVWTEQKDWFGCLYNYDTNYAGFGPIWFIVLLPAFLLALYFAVKKRNSLLIGVLATIALLFAIYPANYYTRYTIFVTGLGIVGLGYTLTHISSIGARLTKGLAILLAIVVIGTNFVLCNFPPGVVKDQLISVIHGTERGPIYNNVPGPAYVFLENKERAGDVVAYDSSPYFIYPLWKSDFSTTVIYVPANGEAQWLRRTKAKHVRYVFTTIGSKEQRWANGHMKNIYKDEMYEIYQTN